ncbi:MAG: DUF1611 domain-containing protein [Deltaproteobacteria bacterium]|nr:MAG: DUF1611 domain-containing protein [Deltaproteobacteria bacterium]
MKAPTTALLAEGAFGDEGASKTAYGILRYVPESVLAVIDSEHAGRDAFQVSGLGRGIPVVRDLAAAIALGAKRLVIGVAPAGGALPEKWRRDIVRALKKGMEVVSGLHTMLGEDEEFQAAAEEGGGRIVDLRRVPEDLDIAICRAQEVSAAVVLTVGTDCNTGKMTTALELAGEGTRRGIETRFCATGQTGIAIAGWGIAVDHAISDFTAGAAERLVLEAGKDKNVKLIVVEGQGALAQPMYSGVTLSLMHGSLPDALILCHRATQRKMDHVELPMPPLAEHVKMYEQAMRLVKPAKVKAIALNTRGLDEDSARRASETAQRETGLPAGDPIRFGAGFLLDAILEDSLKKVPLYSGPPR